MFTQRRSDYVAFIQDVEQQAAAAFAGAQFRECLALIDYRCRLDVPAGAGPLLLRAEASAKLGFLDDALVDARRALEAEPHHLPALRALTRWSRDDSEREAAARTTLSVARDWRTLREALELVVASRNETFAALHREDRSVAGWAVWQGFEPVLVRDDGVADRVLDADPRHPLAMPGWTAASFAMAPRVGRQRVEVRRGGATAAALFVPVDPSPLRFLSRDVDRGFTAIVPIYGDAHATVACLASLIVEGGLGDHRLVLVDDASPLAEIGDILDAVAGEPRVTVLRNSQNLGFAGSVNRALGTLQQADDVLLLNADTIVPAGALDRLQRAGHSARDIGTVMPLSNNGEYTSLPLAFRSNPLPEPDEVRALDRAASANAGRVVDLPSGIGFCLLITAECLSAVGPLSSAYDRGYLEDVDYCLRARRAGFRNVCATDVFVGHAGTRSFESAKRALVVANGRRLEALFPERGAEVAAFLRADPLRPARARLERAAVPAHRGGILLVGAARRPPRLGATRLRGLLEQAATNLSEHGSDGLVLTVGRADGRPVAQVRGLGGRRPQSLQFDLADEAEVADLDAVLAAHAPACIAIYEVAPIDDALFASLGELCVPMDLVLSDAGLLCQRGTLMQPDGRACPLVSGGPSCAACAKGRKKGPVEPYRAVWLARSAAFETVFVDGERSAGFVRRHLPHLTDRLQVGGAPPTSPRPSPRPSPAAGRVLGAVIREASPDSERLLHALARSPARRPGHSLVVMGFPLDDRALHAARDTRVAGAIADAPDFERVLRQHQVDALVIADRSACFGHEVDLLARRSGLPLAGFDWDGDRPIGDLNVDLELDPTLPLEEAAALVHRWHAALDGDHVA